ncbi:hypothetical protein BAUCODRAFT_73956 [Baudoinia panamericana UAMH 10762]|uniref:Uncharacterized protein n=1 Tax=Baudoinia panamericana (strain UAMH 10762) TaxID=717646 RepID=M2N6L5_BAUPA|nr:uncharacterized protein BAUCODRAFT_73956 [Baudoinia panamericana UAMH 10762]EMC94704.1 hypothetical protein BAUCODRAFT_73956 [Baudoinia panamericana UAMH 10762]
MQRHTLDNLPDDVLLKIRDQIEPHPEKTVPIDRRQFLSEESFERPLPPARHSLRDIGHFRCACRRFAEIGEPLLFTKVVTRFSKNGLWRLEQLTAWPHLARHVKKFSYLVPYFYTHDDDSVRFRLPNAGAATAHLDLSSLRQKIAEQHEIVRTEQDVRVLKGAVAKFTALQQIQLLRVADDEDTALLAYIRRHEDYRQFVNLEWAPACLRGSMTIGTALAHANVPEIRFSSPVLSPQSAEFLSAHRPQSLTTLAARLTCLTLHFDDGQDLDRKMSDLSGLFHSVFHSAVNLQAVHVGFPPRRPLNLPLDSVFHNVTWSRLVAFGVQSWLLDAEEIVDLALRHKSGLKGLRLRDVQLREGSMWKDVLGPLRDSMYRLEWVSLRGIGYARDFDETWSGAELPDDIPPGESDSESSEEEETPMPGPSTSHHNTTNDRLEDEDEHWSADTDSDDEQRPEEANEMDFPPLNSPDTPASAPWCNCNGSGHTDSAEHLGDDGERVDNRQRKAWEKWVLKRCPEHDRQH